MVASTARLERCRHREALLEVDADAHRPCRSARTGLLTAIRQMKERKKYGLKRARKAPQYTKR